VFKLRNFNTKLNLIMNTILKIIFPIIILGSICIFFATFFEFNIGTILFSFMLFISIFIGYKLINSNFSNKSKVYLIILIAFILRFLWLLNANSIPTSDFKVMYDSATKFLNNDTSMFKGIEYIGRFPHLTIYVLYMALIQYLFPIHNLLIMKCINLISGLLSVFIIYLLANKLFKQSKKALYCLLIATTFPPLITYTSVFCSENLAIPFYLLSIYIFLSYKDKKFIFLIVSALLLAIGNLFRMIAIVVLIAYTLYIIFYFKNNILEKITSVICLIVPYIILLILCSNLLQSLNITQYPLWKGREPNATSILKGTNMDNLGMWNEEDATLIETLIQEDVSYETIEAECKEKIKNRLINSPIKLIPFYALKIGSQWGFGDCCGALWSQKDLSDDQIIFKTAQAGTPSFQAMYIIILIGVYIGLFDKESHKQSKNINLLYLILCGYIATYLLIENQGRYEYIISWILIPLSVTGLQKTKKILIRKLSKRLSFKLICS